MNTVTLLDQDRMGEEMDGMTAGAETGEKTETSEIVAEKSFAERLNRHLT